MKFRIHLLVLFVSATVLNTSSTRAENRDRFFEKDKLRALILAGRNNHDWRASSQFLKQLLVKTKRFDVRILEEPAGITAHTLSPYDVLVLDYQGPRWGETTEKAVLDFVETGKGLTIVHGGSFRPVRT